MRSPPAALLMPLLFASLACDVCPPGQARGPDGLCGPPAEHDAGLADDPIACWQPPRHVGDPPMVSIGWAAANRGTEDAAFDVWWFASRGPGFNRDDDVLLGIDRGRWLPAETYAGDGRRTVRVSRHMAPDVAHHVGFMLAPTGRPDSNFGNNLSYSATRLVRRPDGECR